jgi:hypothetical protein
MASVLAIVSKAVFEKLAPDAAPGSVVATDRYVSSHKAFSQLAKGDSIFLVTVRPPDERLWLVAILDKPRRASNAWVGTANRAPIRDITGTFKAAKGKLGMSLQTPRALAADVVAALRGGKPVKAARPAVDWAKLATAYGNAKGLDKLIRELASSSRDKRANAVVAVEANIAHQGTIYSASAPALKAIVEVLCESDAIDRAPIARLVGKIAWGTGDGKSTKAVASALAAESPRLLALLGDPDVDVRRAAIVIAARLCATDASVPATLFTRLADETDPTTRVALIVAPMFGDTPIKTWRASCEALLSGPPVDRLAAAAALAAALGAKAPQAVIAPLVAALVDPAPFEGAWNGPFSRGGVVVDLAHVVSPLGELRREVVVPAIAAALDRGATGAALVTACFGKAKAPRDPQALAPVVRDALLRAVDSEAVWGPAIDEALRRAGLPRNRNGLGMWFGRPSLFVLDREVTVAGKEQPLHAVVKAWFKGKKSASSLLAALGAQLAPRDRLDVLDEIYRGTHRIGAWQWDDEAALDAAWNEQLAAIDAPTLEAWARAGLDAATARDDAMVFRRLEALLRARPGPLDARYDAVLPTSWLEPVVHERVPRDRLERIVFDRLVSTAKQLGEPDRGWGIGFSTPAERSARFLTLCPSRPLAELILGLGALSGVWMDVEEEAAKHGAPAVAKVLAEFRKRVRRVQSYPRMREVMADWLAPAFAG